MHDFVPKTASPFESRRTPPSPIHQGPTYQIDPPIFRKASCACGGGCPACASGLRISQPSDSAEIEADRMADLVMRMPVNSAPLPPANNTAVRPGIFRKCFSCEDENMLHRKAGDMGKYSGARELTELIGGATVSGGHSLDRAARGFFEPRFGVDLGSVRVHTDGRADAAARAVDAQAYTRGNDIIFGAGKYAPGTNAGDRLLAHELAHVVQHSAGTHGRKTISRVPNEVTGGKIEVTQSCDGNAPEEKRSTAADAADLEVKTSKNGDACACLLVVHNKERNARKTAELMHENCSYNLATVEPDTGSRCVKLPGHGNKNEYDPNEFFDPGIVKQCVDDESVCRQYLKDKASSEDKAEIDRYVQINYFLKVKECSKSFSLPVIALHNNAINDTADYRKDKKSKAEFKVDIEKEGKDKDVEKLKDLKDKLVKRFSEQVKVDLTETKGKTNIFRWCASQELSACHIGDPDHPDHVTWVTNRKDFDKLKKEPVNVALQDDPARLKPESMTDLSTLFLTLKSLMGAKLGPELTKLQTESLAAGDALAEELSKLIISKILGRRSPADIEELLIKLEKAFTDKKAAVVDMQKEIDKYNDLHFINIEGPGYGLKERTDAERGESYDVIVANLKALGLHCCGKDEAAAEKKVKDGLTLTPPDKTTK